MLAQVKVEHAVERILLGHHAAAHMRQLHRAPVCAVGLEANDAAEVDALGRHVGYGAQPHRHWVVHVQVVARPKEPSGIILAQIVRSCLEQQLPGQQEIVKGVVPSVRVAHHQVRRAQQTEVRVVLLVEAQAAHGAAGRRALRAQRERGVDEAQVVG